MSESQVPMGSEPTDPAPSHAQVIIAVVRSGGIAGISRRWRVEVSSDDADEWITRIDRCPWDAELDDPTGADRFVWSIRALTPSERRERELDDAQLSGPWRELVDAVRAASA